MIANDVPRATAGDCVPDEEMKSFSVVFSSLPCAAGEQVNSSRLPVNDALGGRTNGGHADGIKR